jgi:hypothetical protein
MADPDTNLEMIGLCIQRANALELMVQSIINNTNFETNSGKIRTEENLRYSSHHLNAALKFLNKINTKA